MQTICFLLRGYVHRKNYIITFPGYGVTIEQTKGRNDDKSGDQVTLLQAFHRPWLITSLENTKQEMDCVPTFVIFQMESFLYSKTNILFSYRYIQLYGGWTSVFSTVPTGVSNFTNCYIYIYPCWASTWNLLASLCCISIFDPLYIYV